ncbi:953_t:CDS:1, partial [Dentiscutata heterogama]
MSVQRPVQMPVQIPALITTQMPVRMQAQMQAQQVQALIDQCRTPPALLRIFSFN